MGFGRKHSLGLWIFVSIVFCDCQIIFVFFQKHAHEANTWRVKYERTVEVSKKIQDKRKEDMAKFDKVLNLANGYCKE